MSQYYNNKLSAERLRRCYELATARVRRYLDSEIRYALTYIRPSDRVLELGAGYGRVLTMLARKSRFACGIDTSLSSLKLSRELTASAGSMHHALMDAGLLGFADYSFQVTICIQNGLSAFKVDMESVIKEAMRVTAPGGFAIFSSYTESFWPYRLEWFEIQSRYGLLGPIDYDKTGGGVIVCTDGFRADTISPAQFESSAESLGIKPDFEEIDESSLFCILKKD